MVISDIGQPLLYLIAMGMGLGAVVDSRGNTVDGVAYLVFVAPALLVSTAVMKAAEEMTYPIMEGFKWRRIYFGAAATALRPAQIAIGHMVAVTFRFVAVSVVFWPLMIAFGATTSPWSWLTVPIGALSALAFAAPLQAYASTLRDEGFQFAFVQRFIVMPMFLLSSTLFPITVFPEALQWVIKVMPLWHGIELMRQLAVGVFTSMTLVHVGYFLVMTAAGVAFTTLRLRKLFLR